MSNASASPPTGRRERREEARRTRRERERAAAAAAARRRRITRLGAILAAAAVLVAGAIVVSSRGGDSGGTSTPAATAAPAGALSLAGIPQRGPVLGNPKAPVRVVEFADIQCPFCARFATGQLPAIVNGDVRAGRVRLEFRTLAFLGDDSVKAAKLVEGASRQNRLWNVVDELFAAQGAENSGWVTNGLIERIGASVPGLDLKRALADGAGPAGQAQLQAAESLATRYNVESTPSFLVGRGDALREVNADQLPAAIKSALAGR